MYKYNAPIDEIKFLLKDYFKIYEKNNVFDGLDEDFVSLLLDQSSKISSSEIFPSNSIGDKLGCYLKDGEVYVPSEFVSVFNNLRDNGWFGLDCSEEYGGQQLPYIISTAINEIFSSSNQSLTMFGGLTHGAYSAIYAHGTDEQKKYYLPKMTNGHWTGTMNLTEPQCGTDLGLIKTKAIKNEDDSYEITGTKIFISAGDHNLAENIIHLVLARLPDAPEGVKGISLFIVPKFNTDENYNILDKNGVSCVKLEEKMGIHGSPTCMMEYNKSRGYLLGEPNKGLKAMFTMMNEARLLVGLQGLSQAEISHQFAIQYAKDRIQGQDISNLDNKQSVPIINHPSIRKILMDQKALIEGMRALLFQSALLIDDVKYGKNKDAEVLVSILTPIIKSFLTEQGFNVAVKSQQVYGGHGYLEDWPMSQFVRDSRIAMIYEGTNEVQALDLVLRKLSVNNGMSLMMLFNEIKSYCNSMKSDEEFYKKYILALKDSSIKLQDICMYFMKNTGKLHNVAGSSSDFLNMFAYVLIAYEWSKIAKECRDHEGDFYRDKMNTAEYYFLKILPITNYYYEIIKNGCENFKDFNS